MAKPNGAYNVAAAAGPPSPAKPATPLPAMVKITPAGVILCTVLFELSAKSKLPAESTTILSVLETSALAAWPPAPLNPTVPLPAMVWMR